MAGPAAGALTADQARRALARAFAPAEVRPLLECVTALDAELASLARPDLEHSVAHAKLGWWQQEAARLAAGDARHPLTRALAPFGLPAAPAAAAIESRLAAAARVVAGHVAPTLEELEAELAATHGLPATLLALPLGAAAQDCARRLTLATALSQVVLGVRADARRGLLFLPPAVLDEAQVGPDDLVREVLPGAVLDLQRELARRAAAHETAALSLAAQGIRARLRAQFVEAALARRAVTQAARAGFAEAGPPGRIEALACLVLAWRTARAVDAGREQGGKDG